MNVDETGDENCIRQIDIGGLGRRTRSAAHDRGVRGVHPAWPADAFPEYDGAGRDQRHAGTSVAALGVSSGQRPLFSQKRRISSSCRPLVSGAKRWTRKNPSAARQAKMVNMPAPPMLFSIVRKTDSISALAVRLAVSIALEPIDLMCAGKLSPA